MPFDDNEITLPYGVQGAKPGYYASMYDLSGKLHAAGVKVPDIHDGMDLKANTDTPIRAVINGDATYTPDGELGNRLTIRNKDLGLEVDYGHVDGAVRANGPVDAGEPIAFSGKSGAHVESPHVHLGVREIYYKPDGSGPYYKNTDNGLNGYVDPAQFFPADAWHTPGKEFKQPVDRQYGFTDKTPGVATDAQIKEAGPAFEKLAGHAMTDREYNAMRFGFWDAKTVADPAMFSTWSRMSKTDAIKKGVVKE